MLLACILTEVISRPSNNEATLDEEETSKAALEDNPIAYQGSNKNNISNRTKEILDNFKFVNVYPGKPPKISIENNNPYETNGLLHYILATSALTTGRTTNNNNKLSDSLSNHKVQNQKSRSAKLLPNVFVPNPAVPYMPYPYILSTPIIPPTYYETLGGYNINDNSRAPSNQAIQTRQQLFPNFPSFPSFPSFSFENFQLQPFAQYFPVLIKNPFVALAQGGGWNNFIEYGQNADVCNRKQKSVELTDENIDVPKILVENSDNKAIISESYDDSVKNLIENVPNFDKVVNNKNTDDDTKSDFKSLVGNQPDDSKAISAKDEDDGVKGEVISSIENKTKENKEVNNENNDSTIIATKKISRQSRSIKKRTVPAKAPQQEVEDVETGKKLYATKPSPTRKTTKRPVQVEQDEDFKNSEQEGDLRFPFSDFTFFGNKKPVAPSPGFFINKLKVHRGGVAIAGPGGIATAGRGGTAIVGPGGLAYTKPGGLAIAGPHARVVALSPYADTLPSIFRPHHQGYDFRSFDSVREGKLVATGPIIYYHPLE